MNKNILNRTTYKEAKMDCLWEENIIRIKLEGLHSTATLKFEIPGRNLFVMHEGNAGPITAAIDSLHFNSSLIKTQKIDDEKRLLFSHTTAHQKKLLWQVLSINLSFFVLEIITGFISSSMNFTADSLDMFADAIV